MYKYINWIFLLFTELKSENDLLKSKIKELEGEKQC